MIRKYILGDALKIEVQPEQLAEAAVGATEFDRIEAFSLVDISKGQECVRAVFGFQEQIVGDKKEAECFSLISGGIGSIRLREAIKYLKRRISETVAERKISRVYMTVRCSFTAGRRMAEMLGFEEGCVLPFYFNGDDYQIFERKENNGDTSSVDFCRN